MVFVVEASAGDIAGELSADDTVEELSVVDTVEELSAVDTVEKLSVADTAEELSAVDTVEELSVAVIAAPGPGPEAVSRFLEMVLSLFVWFPADLAAVHRRVDSSFLSRLPSFCLFASRSRRSLPTA